MFIDVNEKERHLMLFRDEALYDPETRTALTVRDGVLEYLGAEIGQQPPEKVFTIYRSPATIAKIASLMNGLPITDEHVQPIKDVPPSNPIGTISGVDIVDLKDMETSSMLALKNTLEFTQGVPDKREFSLGYFGDLRPHDVYDFEQFDLVPHHLAVVEHGRCGSVCSFLDHKKKESIEVKFTFIDEDGVVSLEKIIEIAQALPEALSKVPVEKVQELFPLLQEIITTAKGLGVDMPVDVESEEAVADEAVKEEVATEDEDTTKEEKMPITDSVEFKDALKAMVSKHSMVIDKARNFLDDSYSFADKDTVQVMKDALATQHDTAFADEELDVAFKLLQKNTSYKTFGDHKKDGKESGSFSDLKDKEK